jgi:copper chaperone
MLGDIPPAGRINGKDRAMTTTYTVTGMTCDHCVNAVRTELGALPGVTDVQVDLAAGTATVTSDQPLDPRAVRAAVDEAGYAVVI